jgi:hypothetical protein
VLLPPAGHSARSRWPVMPMALAVIGAR